MATKFSFPTDAVPVASGIAPEVLARILVAPTDLSIVRPGDEKPTGQWYLKARGLDKGRRNPVVYLYRPDGGRLSMKVVAGSPDWEARARLRAQAEIALARDALLTRMAPETVAVCDLLGEYLDAAGARAERGEILDETIDNYRKRVARLARCLRDTTLDRVGPDFPDRYFAWAKADGLAFNTALDDLSLLRRGANEALTRRKAGARVTYRLPERQPAEKQPLTPPELDRLLLACLGYRFVDEDTLAMAVDPATGEATPFRHPPEVLARRAPFYLAVEIDVATGTRKTATCEMSWLDLGGPWIDLDGGVLHRQGSNQRRFKVKRRGAALLPPELVDVLRPIAEADLRAGCVWVIHDAEGNRLRTLKVPTWREILADALVTDRRYHATKDTGVQISRHQRVRLYDAAEYFQTTPRTLVGSYGADFDLGLQIDVATAMGRRDLWRQNHAANEARAKAAAAAREARAARRLPPPTPLALPPPDASPPDEPAPAACVSADGPAGAVALAATAHDLPATIKAALATLPPPRKRRRGRQCGVRPWPGRVDRRRRR